MKMVIFFALFCVLFFSGAVQADLQLGFYKSSCPKAEKLIQDFVKEHIPNAPSLASPLLRMHFHDCFVRGCDASVLINSTSSNNQTEKVATPNLTLRGFDFIDRVKSVVEAESAPVLFLRGCSCLGCKRCCRSNWRAILASSDRKKRWIDLKHIRSSYTDPSTNIQLQPTSNIFC
ncbi:hypothetical protein J5N97_016716 [Dioscorea zingiberensis]|uniref:Plant heme peroxidase family profile domain-containing protein n=1 Tax=Dioscorea zingiberensis TaxID=325984 RepID=A0A9D5CJX5_9LILI|nr:hypothetical protein J5N97_016716 [Dioscorea zingiberensis]